MDDVIELQNHMLAHVGSDDDLADELRGYFRRYRFSVVAQLVADDGMICAGLADLQTGEIELNRSLLDAPCERVLHVYLHEVAHIVSDSGHTLDFASLAAGMQEHFQCRDTSRRRLRYDMHETDVDEWRTSEYAHLQRGGSVRAIADPHAWIEHRRASQEALAAERWRQQNVWPNVLALVVAVLAVAGIVAWPWISELLADRILRFAVGFAVAACAILWSLLSVNNT